MKRGLQLGFWANGLTWRTIACFLLIGFLLYNPFLILGGTANGISIQHQPSYRATVAGTDVQRDKAEQIMASLLPSVMALALCLKLAVPALVFLFFLRKEHRRPLPLLVSPSSLWFRPPPAV